ncbi:MAG: ABC transporter permease [Acidobacteria bacterium]|nr:ABC transporter permease [Acidobacteriota bacterium]
MSAFQLQPVLVPFYALFLSVIAGGLLMLAAGVNPIDAYWALLRGMFGSADRIAGSVARSVPYVGSALALTFAARAGLFNIGAEGQMLIGGVAAGWVGTWAFLADAPGVLLISAIVLAGIIGGGFWGFIPGVLRVTTGAHEVITTIMLNSIALFLTRWLVNSRDPVVLRDITNTAPSTRPIPDAGRLPELVDSNPPLHWGVFLMIAAAVLVWFVFKRTTLGFEMTTVGTNPLAANYAGIGVSKILVIAMTVSGALAGLAAASEVSGTNGVFQPGAFLAIGFDGIAIALLARGNPIAILPASLLWGAMLSGAPLMQAETGASIDIVRVIQALVLLFVAADAIVRQIFRLKGEATGLGVSTTGWSS